MLWAYSGGPPPGVSGVPGEGGGANCTSCHLGTANGFTGSVTVTFSGGNTYVPGVKQHLVVTIADPAATQRRWGFQLTARRASDPSTVAGSFASTGPFTLVICSPAILAGETVLTTGGACAASRPLQYIEHSAAGSARNAAGSMTYEFDWTPPDSDVGEVVFYVSGNAANGNFDPSGDHIFTNRYTVSAAGGGSGDPPTVSSVEHGASFIAGVVPNAFLTIRGADLASATSTWDGAITGGRLPTTLEGASVSIGGKPAYMNYVSPTQLNILAPPDVGAGAVQVTVTRNGVTSAAFTANSNDVGPAFFQWPGNQAVATRNADASWAVKNGTFAGVNTVPAKPGDVILLWGTGFGPTNPAAPAGTQVPEGTIYNTASPVTVTVGGVPVTVFGAALTPNFAGLYQVAIQIPDNAPNGDLPVVATIGGAQSPATAVIAVQR